MKNPLLLPLLGVLGLASCASPSSSIASTSAESTGLESLYVVAASGGA